MNGKTEMLRHALATLSYRTAGAVRNAPAGFGGFSAGAGVRTPSEILVHMSYLMGYTLDAVEGRPREEMEAVGDFGAEAERFEDLARRLSLALADSPLEAEHLHEKLLQGPVSDALTHVGQIAMLRRLAGAPIEGEDFFAAAIRAPDPSAHTPDPSAEPGPRETQ